jgi:cytochrome c biogenesis protein CcmG/thiol:disulfide interchange protein DsbE
LIIVLAMAACLPAIAQQKTTPRSAPDFTLTALDGKQVRLSDYSGDVVLLDFWATWCVPCRTEIPRFVSFQNKFAKQGFQVIGISMDDNTAPVRRFYAELNMNYPVALGTEKVATAYGGVLGLPLTYLIARDGRIVGEYDGSADLNKMEQQIEHLLQQQAARN